MLLRGARRNYIRCSLAYFKP